MLNARLAERKIRKGLGIIKRHAATAHYNALDRSFQKADQRRVKSVPALRFLPDAKDRQLSQESSTEWGYAVGVWRALMSPYLLKQKQTIVDIGCGRGLLFAALRDYVISGSLYFGIDVDLDVVKYCRTAVDDSRAWFLHLNAANAYYAPDQNGMSGYPLTDHTADLVVAKSVWSHLNEAEAVFYMREVGRLLKPGGTALVSLFLLDERYHQITNKDKCFRRGTFYNQKPRVFDTACSGSGDWFTMSWFSMPEREVAITCAGLCNMAAVAGLSVVGRLPGTWKDQAGPFFQDIVILRK